MAFGFCLARLLSTFAAFVMQWSTFTPKQPINCCNDPAASHSTPKPKSPSSVQIHPQTIKIVSPTLTFVVCAIDGHGRHGCLSLVRVIECVCAHTEYQLSLIGRK